MELAHLLADDPVDGLPDQVGVPVVPRVLLDHVEHDPPQRDRLVDSVQPPYGQGVEANPGGQLSAPDHGVVVQGAKRLRIIRGRGVPIPVGVGFPVDVTPGRCPLVSVQEQENQLSSTKARCFSIPPRVIDEGCKVWASPAASRPAAFLCNVARW